MIGQLESEPLAPDASGDQPQIDQQCRRELITLGCKSKGLTADRVSTCAGTGNYIQ